MQHNGVYEVGQLHVSAFWQVPFTSCGTQPKLRSVAKCLTSFEPPLSQPKPENVTTLHCSATA